MHENICNLCNEIVYRGELKCANETVRSSKLTLSRYPKALPTPIQQASAAGSASGSSSTSSEASWLHRVLNPDTPAVFVDTDAIGSSATGAFQGLERSSGRRQGGTIVNDTEVSLVRNIVRCLLKCGLNSASIGVICPYRSQLRLLDDDKFLRRMKKTGLEMSTIDRYQGRDKSAIVISLVRSNAEGKSGRLLEDFRRLNVAISRAKRKLIIVGSMKTLTNGSDVLRPVLQSMSRQGWVESLPRNAIEMYESPLLPSQAPTTQPQI
jgi:DNA replication ATP-dependent helicase Dna2